MLNGRILMEKGCKWRIFGWFFREKMLRWGYEAQNSEFFGNNYDSGGRGDGGSAVASNGARGWQL